MSAIASIQSAAIPHSDSTTIRSAVEMQPEAPFARMLHAAAQDSDREALREAASALVASALLMPAMSALEHSPWRGGGAFAKGAAERRFAPLLYQRLADEISKAANFPIIDGIVNRFAPLRPEAGHDAT